MSWWNIKAEVYCLQPPIQNELVLCYGRPRRALHSKRNTASHSEGQCTPNHLCALATDMKLDVVVSKWWTPRLHVVGWFVFASKPFLSTENVAEAALKTYYTAALSSLDGFNSYLTSLGGTWEELLFFKAGISRFDLPVEQENLAGTLRCIDCGFRRGFK